MLKYLFYCLFMFLFFEIYLIFLPLLQVDFFQLILVTLILLNFQNNQVLFYYQMEVLLQVISKNLKFLMYFLNQLNFYI